MTNVAFLAALSRDPDFVEGTVDTGMIGRRQETLTAIAPATPAIVSAALLAASGLDNLPPGDDPWSSLSGYSHFHPVERRTVLGGAQGDVVAYLSAGPEGRAMIRFDGERERQAIARDRAPRTALWPGHVSVFSAGACYDFTMADPFAKAAGREEHTTGMRAPMPGFVKIVRAASGDTVSKGQPLLVLEAMKMEHTIAATRDGVVAEIAAEGAQITEGTVLVTFEEA